MQVAAVGGGERASGQLSHFDSITHGRKDLTDSSGSTAGGMSRRLTWEEDRE